MIRITYASAEKPLAERIRDDLAREYRASAPLLIVLVSQDSIADPHVGTEIDSALAEGVHILPLLIEPVPLPPPLRGWRTLNFSDGYDRERLLKRLAPHSTKPADLRRANRRGLALAAAIAALMFGIAIIAMARGMVAFPVAEYNEEATFQSLWIGGLIRETLEDVQPRTTEDAQNFPATHEAAPTRLYLYIRETATALAKEGDG